jgi:hypothetical protein
MDRTMAQTILHDTIRMIDEVSAGVESQNHLRQLAIIRAQLFLLSREINNSPSLHCIEGLADTELNQRFPVPAS